jgi:hypothetical protein
VSIVVLQEWDERCGDRGNLLRRYVHEVNVCRGHNGEVGVLTTLDDFTDKGSVVVQRGIALTDDVVLLLVGSEIDDIVVIEVGNTILYLTVRSRDEAEFINLGIDTE